MNKYKNAHIPNLTLFFSFLLELNFVYKKIEFLPQLISTSSVALVIWAYYSSGFLKTKFRKFYDIKSNSIKWVYRYSFKAISVIFLFLSSVTFLTFILGIPVTLSEEI